MRTPVLLLSLGLTLGLLVSAPAQAQERESALDRYVKKPQPSYAWVQRKAEARPGGVSWVRFHLTSQEWRGINWKHRLNLIVPPPATGERARPGHAVLVITGGGREDQLLMVITPLAQRLGVPIAILHDVPNQPLFREETGRKLKEDALIAYTFKRFVETGDETWPALFPMVKSAMAAMDCLGEYSAKQGQSWPFARLNKFVTTGGSKRGWTTWLSAVADSRVIGIAPIVYDNLKVGEQIALHMKTFGRPSPSIHDYTDAGLLDYMPTPRGRQLMRMVDPWSYRERITVPKMAMIGTNDTYWPLESIHVYAHELPGDVYCHYVPGAGHGAGLSVLGAAAGFFDFVTKRTPDLPEVKMTILPGDRAASFRALRQPKRIERVRLWGSHVAGRDFTKSEWKRVEAPRAGQRWRASLPVAVDRREGRAAFIGELELKDSAGEVFTIHTPVQVWDLGRASASE